MVIDLLNRLFGGSRETPPNSIQTADRKDNCSKRKEMYSYDVATLKKQYGVEFRSGLCIEIPLKEIINLCTRTRHRKDAYIGLISYLKSEYGVTLKITSNKTKIKNDEN